MLFAFFLAALLHTQADNRPPTAGADQIHLASERKFTPAAGQLEAIVSGGSLSGLPGVRCDEFAPAVLSWRVKCHNDSSGGGLTVVRQSGDEPKSIATLNYKLIFVSSFALHDQIVIRTLGIRGNGEATETDYFWKPPQTKDGVRR